MTADIDAVLSRLRERPECRDAVEVIERLTAERDRLREACFEASKRLYGSLARHRDLDLDLVSYRHLLGASTILAALAAGKPVHLVGEPNHSWVAHPLVRQFETVDDAFAALAPSHPTGEERDR